MIVTIVTVAYNSESTIARTIESVLSQSYNKIEYIIVDGASCDSTLEIAQSYMKSFYERDGWSMKIISEPDTGMYDALNKGIKAARGEIIGSINSDDWYEPDAVKKMATLYLKEHYDIAWGNMNVIKQTGNFVKRARIGKWIWSTSGFCHPCMFASKAILTEFPYACESLYDDFDLITRVHRARRKIVVLNEVIANYVFGGMSTMKSWKATRERISHRNHIYQSNGYGFVHRINGWIIEILKYLLG